MIHAACPAVMVMGRVFHSLEYPSQRDFPKRTRRRTERAINPSFEFAPPGRPSVDF